jgi:site-specific recombinase XerD
MEHYLNKLRKDMDLRGFADSSKEHYHRYVKNFLCYWRKPPETATENDISNYLHKLISVKKPNPSTVNHHNTSLRFFFETTLKKTLNFRAIPRCKIGKKMPVVLSRDEIWRLFDVSELKVKAILMTFYGSGIRLAELSRLKVSDIDSENMQILIRQGKPKTDRFALLSQSNLEILREYWKAYRPKEWLFESRSGCQYTTRAIQMMLERTLKKAGIKKNATIHTLRHSFATHLMEDGADVFKIKKLMGHASLASTAVYVHMTNLNTLNVKSPLEKMEGLTNG